MSGPRRSGRLAASEGAPDAKGEPSLQTQEDPSPGDSLKDFINQMREEMASMRAEIGALREERRQPVDVATRVPEEAAIDPLIRSQEHNKQGKDVDTEKDLKSHMDQHINLQSPVQQIDRMFSDDKVEHDLKGLKLKLSPNDCLRGSENWEEWYMVLTSALESTGWEMGQPLSRAGEGQLTLAILANTAANVRQLIKRINGGSKKLIHLWKTYSNPSHLHKDAAMKQLNRLRLERSDNPSEFVSHFETTIAEYKRYEPLSDDGVVRQFFQATEDAAGQWVNRQRDYMLWSMKPVTPQIIFDNFLQEAQKWHRKEKAESKKSSYATDSRNGSNTKTSSWVKKETLCWRCGERGHISRECKRKPNPELVKREKEKDGKKRTIAMEQANLKSEGDLGGAFVVSSDTNALDTLRQRYPRGGQTNFCFSATRGTKDEWLWDTGSDLHITNDLSDLHDVIVVPHGECPIQTGGGIIYPTHVGDVHLMLTASDGHSAARCTMKTVVVVPSMPIKIMSGERFLCSGGSLHGNTLVLSTGKQLTSLNIQRRGCILWRYGTPEPTRRHPGVHTITVDGTTSTLVQPRRQNTASVQQLPTDDASVPAAKVNGGDTEVLKRLLEMCSENSVSPAGDLFRLSDEAIQILVLWHRRLAHCSAQRLRWTVKRTTGIDLDTSTITSLPCAACDEANITKIPSHDPFKPATYAGESIHFDLGSISPKSVDNYKYFSLRTDLYSRLREISFHRSKTEVMDSLVNAIKRRNDQLRQHSLRRVRVVHIDGARELTNEGVSTRSSEFEKLCEMERIELTVSAPQNHHQNPYAERSIRILQDAARVMSVQMRIPSVLWTYVLAAAAHITNRTATSSLEGELPIRVFRKSMEGLNEEPEVDLSHLRVVGSLCTAYVERSERMTAEKLEPRGVKAILLGFAGEHNYLVWVLDGGRVLRTPNLIFQEDVGDGVKDGIGVPELPDPRDVIRSLPPATQRRLRHRAKPKSSIRTKDLNIVEEDQTDQEDGQIKPTRGRPKKKARQLYVCEAPPDNEELVQHLLNQVSFFGTGDCSPNFRQAIEGPEWLQWKAAMFAEIHQLLERGTFEFVAGVTPENIVSARWVLQKKLRADGTLEKYKGRLVARGFTQQLGVDYHETSASTARAASWRILLALAAVKGWPVIQSDFVGAYLAGHLEETIYMGQFELLCEFFRDNPTLASKYKWSSSATILLRRPLYGLKQSGANWQKYIRELLLKHGIRPLSCDDAMYQSQSIANSSGGGACHRILAASHVDDFLWTGPNKEAISHLLANLRSEIDCSENDAEWYLGVRITRSRDQSIHLDQAPYIANILEYTGMAECRPSAIPIDPGAINEITSLSPGSSEPVSLSDFLKVNGRAMYAGCITRPDIAFATSFWARFAHVATRKHYEGLKQMLRYLKSTPNLGLKFQREHRHLHFGELGLHGVVDASFASDVGTSKSTSGYVFFMGGAPVLWRSAIQSTVAQSSTEAEHYAINEAVRDAGWIRKLLEELDLMPEGTIQVLNDNTGAITWSHEGDSPSRQKRHVRVRFDYVKQEVEENRVSIEYIPTSECPADVLTKGLDRTKHGRAVRLLGLEAYPGNG